MKKGVRMRYMFMMFIFCILGIVSLYAEENSLGDILQELAEKKPLVKPVPKKKIDKKRSQFVFKDTYEANGLAAKDKSREKKRSQQYEYVNKSKFKFKINDGSPQSNMMGGPSGSSAGGTGNSGKGRSGGR